MREPWEHEEGRIAGAQNIPLGTLPTQLDELERAARHPDCPYGVPLVATIRQQLAELYPQLEARAEA